MKYYKNEQIGRQDWTVRNEISVDRNVRDLIKKKSMRINRTGSNKENI